jgi:hypothetical protein
MSDKTAVWKSRVTAWKASGQTAEVFAASHDLTAGTLRWWASRLRREERQQAAAPAVRLVRVVRPKPSAGRPREVSLPASGLVIELCDVHARIAIEGRVDHDALTTVLAVLRAGTR